MAHFFVKRQGKVFGPLSSSELKSDAQKGQLSRDDLIGKTEQGPWQVAKTISGLNFAKDTALRIESDKKVDDRANYLEESADSSLEVIGSDSHSGVNMAKNKPPTVGSSVQMKAMSRKVNQVVLADIDIPLERIFIVTLKVMFASLMAGLVFTIVPIVILGMIFILATTMARLFA